LHRNIILARPKVSLNIIHADCRCSRSRSNNFLDPVEMRCHLVPDTQTILSKSCSTVVVSPGNSSNDSPTPRCSVLVNQWTSRITFAYLHHRVGIIPCEDTETGCGLQACVCHIPWLGKSLHHRPDLWLQGGRQGGSSFQT